MASEQWYPVYDAITRDVIGGGPLADLDNFDPGDGLSVGEPQSLSVPGEPPLVTETNPPVFNYTYNTETNLVEPKA